MKKNFFLILFSFSCIVLGAQDYDQPVSENTPKWGFTAGYTAYLINNPGFNLGIEHTLASTKHFKILSNLTIHTYFEKDVQSGGRLNLGYGPRATFPFGLFLENYISIGYEHYYFTKKTFVLNDGIANFSETKDHKSAFTPDISIGIGYDFSKISSFGLLFFTRPTLCWRIPDRNLVFQNSFLIDAGLIVYPKLKKQK